MQSSARRDQSAGEWRPGRPKRPKEVEEEEVEEVEEVENEKSTDDCLRDRGRSRSALSASARLIIVSPGERLR
jgi:hypothetical protein